MLAAFFKIKVYKFYTEISTLCYAQLIVFKVVVALHIVRASYADCDLYHFGNSSQGATHVQLKYTINIKQRSQNILKELRTKCDFFMRFSFEI